MKELFREYLRAQYKRYGEFFDYADFILLPDDMGYPDYKGYDIIEELKKEIIRDSNKLSNNIHDLGELPRY